MKKIAKLLSTLKMMKYAFAFLLIATLLVVVISAISVASVVFIGGLFIIIVAFIYRVCRIFRK